ncbi:MAG TPA: endonuclease domain-containing protein [Thermoanaerobaculia bacterium]|nr:endonuclease domain-containing protein [Thermoanaerobaculia bacterium]
MRKTSFARQLRRNLTRAERRIWYWLRDRRFADVKFRRQYPIGPFILDFYSPELRLAIEIDGPVHYEEDQRLYDNRRDRYLTRHGIAIMRLPTETVEKDPDVAGDQIALAIEMRRR